jgi:glycosyltransferase involved in cell wall biosynthesis
MSAADPSPAAAKRQLRVLVATVGVPHPQRGASAVLFWHYIHALCAAGHEVFHIVLSSELSQTAEYEADMQRFGRFSVLSVRTGPFLEESMLRHRRTAQGIEAARARAAAFAPDAVVVFDVLAAWALAPLPAAPKLVWLGDLMYDSQRYHALYAWREGASSLLHTAMRFAVARAWKPVYRSALAGCETLLASSHSSVAALAKLGLKAVYEPYAWPDAIRPDTTRSDAEHRGVRSQTAVPTFAFFGGLDGLGSRSALHFCFDQLLPRLRARWGGQGFRLLLAGSGDLPEWTRAHLAAAPEFETLGFVEDLGALLATCHAVLAPIDVPVGNRSRIVTAMALGVPVIAHRNAALGNPDLVDGVTCWLADDAESFVDRMGRAVERPADSEWLTARARTVYDRAFSPQAACARFLAHVVALADRRPDASALYSTQRWPT